MARAQPHYHFLLCSPVVSIIGLPVEKHNFTSLEILSEGTLSNINAHNYLQNYITPASHKVFCPAHWKTYVLFSISVASHKTNEPKVIFKFLNIEELAYTVLCPFVCTGFGAFLPGDASNSSLKVPLLRGLLGSVGLGGWRRGRKGKVGPAHLLLSSSPLDLLRSRHDTLRAKLNVCLLPRDRIILINQGPQHSQASQRGQPVPPLCTGNPILQVPIFPLVAERERYM